jgi:hypothetical protein
MHAIANVADGWERFGNAFSPTPSPHGEASNQTRCMSGSLTTIDVHELIYVREDEWIFRWFWVLW